MTVPPGNTISTFAYIGSLPIQRVHSSVQWRQGPCFLIEDILSSPIIAAIYGAGPNYIGSFQAVCIGILNDYKIENCFFFVIKIFVFRSIK
jgi:hypothetical protein